MQKVDIISKIVVRVQLMDFSVCDHFSLNFQANFPLRLGPLVHLEKSTVKASVYYQKAFPFKIAGAHSSLERKVLGKTSS